MKVRFEIGCDRVRPFHSSRIDRQNSSNASIIKSGTLRRIQRKSRKQTGKGRSTHGIRVPRYAQPLGSVEQFDGEISRCRPERRLNRT